MSDRCYLRLALVIGMTGFLTSCASHDTESAASVGSLPEVPETLLTIDEKAEQIVAAATINDWPRVDSYINDIAEAWEDYQSSALDPERQPSIPPAARLSERVSGAVGVLRDAAAKQDVPATAKAANDLSAAAVDLYEYYHPAIPSDLRQLEIIERRILIDLSYGAFDSASAALNRGQDVWQRVRPKVVSRTGSEVAQAVGDQLNIQKTALEKSDASAVTASVETTIKLIDEIQRLY